MSLPQQSESLQEPKQGHPIRCQCGAIRARLTGRGVHNRVICYCTDCRAFTRYLGQQQILDAQGGCEVIQVAQHRLHWQQGLDALTCLRLSPNGLLRWYCRHCHTPIGNTTADAKLSFIGLISSCLDRTKLDSDFAAEPALVNTNSALGEPKPQQRGLAAVILRFVLLVVGARLSGRWRQSALFLPDGAPRCEPLVLTAAQKTELKQRDFCCEPPPAKN
jgi:hypothetical protein